MGHDCDILDEAITFYQSMLEAEYNGANIEDFSENLVSEETGDNTVIYFD